MKYKINHITTYDYQDIVAVSQNETHVSPRAATWQTCDYHRLIVRPTPTSTTRRTDYFGNPVTSFSINDGHRRLKVTSISKVTVRPAERPQAAETAPWESVRDGLRADRSPRGLDAYQFCFDSPRVRAGEALAEYARESFAAGRPTLEAALDLTARMHADFTYDPQATNVLTPLEEVFENRRGVCQDLAHVQIGCLRSVGLAARYVSGYLRTLPPPGKPRLVGADASHAWISIFCGPAGWIDLDPTNNALVSTDHVTVAWGRDYSDVCPVNGMFTGGGAHTMSVSVDVEPLDDSPNSP